MTQHNLPQIAQEIMKQHIIIFDGNFFYEYSDGVYRRLPELIVKRWVHKFLGDEVTTHKVNEVLEKLRVDAYVEKTQLNWATNMLNLKNGMLDIDTLKFSKHDPRFYSTIQLPVNYNPKIKCPKWVKALDEIFMGDKRKIGALQEFFGLCLTTDTSFEKCLFCVGEGANGKSVIMYVLQQLLGQQNCSAVPLEKFGDRHYLAQLFGKLVNISIETNTKTAVYEATVKGVTSGDMLEADQKYSPPFSFRPFSKLIFTLNNLPRVDDKSDGFFRKLLVLRFNRKFKGKEQDKRLKYKLVEKELDGVFNWCLAGLAKLRRRKDFLTSGSIQEEIDNFRKENNNVMLFIEDRCVLDPKEATSKRDLYMYYRQWCQENGHQPLSMIKFGRELLRQYPDVITDERSADDRLWGGVKLR